MDQNPQPQQPLQPQPQPPLPQPAAPTPTVPSPAPDKKITGLASTFKSLGWLFAVIGLFTGVIGLISDDLPTAGALASLIILLPLSVLSIITGQRLKKTPSAAAARKAATVASVILAVYVLYFIIASALSGTFTLSIIQVLVATSLIYMISMCVTIKP